MPSRRRVARSVMDTAASARSVFSEEAKQLKQFLLDLDSELETQVVLKDVEAFLFSPDHRWRIKNDDISSFRFYVGRFLLGDIESKGFLYYCFQVKHGCHYFCCLFLETLSKILSKSFNPNSDKFKQMITCLPLSKLKQLGIGAHIETSGFKRCKKFSFELVALFEAANPRTNYSSLFISARMKAAYNNWREKQLLVDSVQSCTVDSPTRSHEAIRSSYKVFSQPVEAIDYERKKAAFVKVAESYFKDDSCDHHGVQVKIDLQNCDMAALRCTFSLDDISDIPMNTQSRADSITQQENQSDVQIPQILSTLPADNSELSFRGKFSQYLKYENTIPGSDHVSIVPKPDNTVDVKINHKNTVFGFKLRIKPNKKNQDTENVLGKLNFETVNDSNTLKVDPLETSIEMKVLSDRKVSFGCNCSEQQLAGKCCGSTASTTCGSELAFFSSLDPHMLINMEGSLTLSKDSSTWSRFKSSDTYNMNILLLSKDQQSRPFVRTIPAIRQALKNLFIQVYAIMIQE